VGGVSNRRTRANGEGSIFPYRNGFAAYAWVTNPDGRRARKYVYGSTREAVHEKWIHLQVAAQAGPIATSAGTLGAFLDYWLAEIIEPNRAPATFDNYERFVRLYIKPGLGEKRLSRLQVRDVQHWINQVSKACQCCAQGKDAGRLESKRRCCARPGGRCCADVPSARMVSDIRNALRSALSAAISEELLTKNVAAPVKLATVRKRKGKVWTSDEARQFLESARADEDPYYAAYVLVLVLGLRRGEVLGLVWDDIDLDAAELRVGLQLQRIRRRLLHRATKTETSDAVLPLPEICVTALRYRKARQESQQKAFRPQVGRPAFVFTTVFGTPVEPRNFFRSYVARIVRAGVRQITIHDARRTCATLLADLDVHPRVAMQILRHADFKVTMEIYTSVSTNQTQEALRRLAERIS
jgi:integrase